MKELILYNFFPKHLNLYGDRGNIQVLEKRSKWRGIELIVKDVTHLSSHSLEDADLLYIGGGGDREQQLISHYFERSLSKNIKGAIQDGVVCLAICGGYQLLGHYYETQDGNKIKGIELFDYYTKAKNKRLVGDVLVESEEFGTLLGFENHAGQTFHNGKSLGNVTQGWGNNEVDRTEGFQEGHFIGSYMHGPLLPKNILLADRLISWAIKRKYGENHIETLNDDIELKAKEQAIKRIRKRVSKG